MTTGQTTQPAKPTPSQSEEDRATIRAAAPRRGPGGGGGPFGSMGMPAEKSLDFGPSAKRLLGRLRPEKFGVALVFALAVISVSFSVLGPKILGRATDTIFSGIIARRLPAGQSKEAVIAALRAKGDNTFADLISGIDLVPGRGIDFSALGRVLLIAGCLYVAASIFAWLQGFLLNGIVQRTIRRLRGDVEEKLNRLPLAYFDRQQRGEVLSRVTNDIDNISQSLQQTMSQLLTSLLTVVGVLVMMVIISFALALIALVAIPLSILVTTLVNLILRFYEIDGGSITLDGVDTRKMTRSDLRSRIGMVLQDTWLFGGTIAENIRYGRPDATEAEILAAAQATYVDRFVHSLPDGYDTVINFEGSNVSAGEKQLITIARAFLADPSLLILDEATSSVDTRTEVLVQHAMAALRTDRTSFVIAHRLSTIRDADLILVMEAGRIVQQGNHEQLLEYDGAYARLYNAQFAGAVVEEEPAVRRVAGPSAKPDAVHAKP